MAKLKRQGKVTPAEKMLVHKVVQDQPRALTKRQVNGLANALRRAPETIKAMIAEAQEHFLAHAEYYVQAHREAVEKGLEIGDAKGLMVAQQGAEWAMEHLRYRGEQVIEPPAPDRATGPRILVGVQVGGIKDPHTTVRLVSQGTSAPSESPI